jgi:hypothetical protein
MKIRTFVSIAAIPALLLAGTALAAPKKTDTQADTNHPNIHAKVGQGDGTNANPNNANENGGDIHGINNTYGHNGDHPNADGTKGFANELYRVHGGIFDVNPQVDVP